MPPGKKGVNDARKDSERLPLNTHNPATMITVKTRTLPHVAHWPPPVCFRIRERLYKQMAVKAIKTILFLDIKECGNEMPKYSKSFINPAAAKDANPNA